MCVSILGNTSYSSVLATGHSSLMGSQFLPMMSSLPDFRIRMTIVLSHISCICPVEIDRHKMVVRQFMAP